MMITVTGSTGTVGSELVDLLSAAGAPVRAVLRDFSRARGLPGVAWIMADLTDEKLLEPVVAGSGTLFVLTGNQPGFGKTQADLIRAAARAGVKHVVKLSALGATPRSRSPLALEHWEAEEVLRDAGMEWTILRPHAFMQNWVDDHADTVRQEGAIHAAIGDGRVPFIDARDIVAVAAEIMLRPEGHTGKTYVLTGGEAIGYADLAAALTETLGKSVKYVQMNESEARARLEARGLGPELIEGYLALAAYQRAGGPTAEVHGDVHAILGRAPRTVRDFARDYAGAFA